MNKKETDSVDVFKELFKVNVNDHTETKEGLTYLSWPFAIAEVCKAFPNFSYEVHRFGDNQLPYVYDDATGYMVSTEVTINGITHEMWLPVMDSKNKAMKAKPYSYFVKGRDGKSYEKTVEAATMFDINKSIMRCLVKNLAMFGLGLYIYAGEDIPEITLDDIRQEISNAKSVTELKEIYKNHQSFKNDIYSLVVEKQKELTNGKADTQQQ